MSVQWVICPGVHSPACTDAFLAALAKSLAELGGAILTKRVEEALVFPGDRRLPYCGCQVLAFLNETVAPTSTIGLMGFSAGVVGAIAAAWGWRSQGRSIHAFIALDGWGVPLGGDFPIYRLSHDWLTHLTSIGLGHCRASFYADPGVPHLELWRSPHTTIGWQMRSNFTQPTRTTAARFIGEIWQSGG